MHRRHIPALALAVIWFAFTAEPARACTCAAPPENIYKAGHAAIQNWRFEKAANVVRGRIVSLETGEEKTGEKIRAVIAIMKVSKALKGNVTAPRIAVVTGFGLGDCGIPSAFLSSVALDRDVELEIYEAGADKTARSVIGTSTQLPAGTRPYTANSCGFGRILSLKEQEASDKGER